MKTKKIALFCILTALAVLAGGFAWLYLSPGGVLRPNGPEEYMQSLLASSTSADWQERIGESWDKAVSEFEEAADIYGKTFSAAANGEFSFREYEPVFRRRKPVYILSAGETDLCLVALRYDDGWQIGDITVPAGLLEAERRTVSVTVPAGAEVYVNGILLEEHHRKEDFVPYEDMKPLEGRYTAVPHRQRWEVAGLYETPELAFGSRERNCLWKAGQGRTTAICLRMPGPIPSVFLRLRSPSCPSMEQCLARQTAWVYSRCRCR